MFVYRTSPFSGDLESVYQAPPEVVIERPTFQDIQRVFGPAQSEEIQMQDITTQESVF